jgi:hypothetical protein
MPNTGRWNDVLLIEPEMRRWAKAWTGDANLAHALVHHTLLNLIGGGLQPPDGCTRSWAAEGMRETIGAMGCFADLRPSPADDVPLVTRRPAMGEHA